MSHPAMFFMIFLSWLLGFTSPAAAQIADQAEPPVQQEWERHYLGPSGTAEAAGMAMDSQGNIIVSGQTGVGSGVDYATIKYSPAGEHLWVSRYNGSGDNIDLPGAPVVDGQDNVYVTGSSCGVGGIYDYATIKYSPEGKRVWVRRFHSPYNGDSKAVGLAVDGQGNVYVTGHSRLGASAPYGYATIKYSPAGEQLWVSRFMGPGSDNDPAALVLDGQGNVYVTGYSAGVDGKTDYATVKYSPDGEELWVIRYSRAGDDKPVGLALDGQGNVYVTGTSQGPTGTNDITTLKYRQQ